MSKESEVKGFKIENGEIKEIPIQESFRGDRKDPAPQRTESIPQSAEELEKIEREYQEKILFQKEAKEALKKVRERLREEDPAA